MYKIWMRAYSDFCDKGVHILQFLRHNCVLMENLITKRIQQYLESTIHHRQKLEYSVCRDRQFLTSDDLNV